MPNVTSPQAKSGNIFDLIDSSNRTPSLSPQVNKPSTNALDDLLGLSSVPTNTPIPPVTNTATNSNDMFDIFSSNTTIPKAAPLKTPSQVVAFEKNNLKITFESTAESEGTSTHHLNMIASNEGSSVKVTEFLFGVAVPKSMQMQLSQPTSSVIEPLDSMKQTITIANPNMVNLVC